MSWFFGIVAAWSLLVSGVVQAAPVATNIIFTLTIQGLSPISFSEVGTVSVSGSTVSIAAGTVSLPAPVVVPVTSTTAINSIAAMTISNQAGTFSAGGVTVHAPGEVCGGGVAPGIACNTGGGVGGAMGLDGFVNVFTPVIVPIPVDLNAAQLGQGGATASPFTIDAAVFSTGVGAVNSGTNIVTLAGASGPLTLVSPTFVSVLGNQFPIFTTITFTNVSLPVPEPGSLLAMATGFAGLLLLASRRK